MTKTNGNTDPKEDFRLNTAKEFLFEEYKLFKGFFEKDLGLAERRVNFFIKLAGGSVSFVVTLIGLSASFFGENLGGYYQFLMLGAFLSLILIVIGHSILTRVAYMNVSHEKWKQRIGLVRKKICELCNSKQLKEYTPFRADRTDYMMKKDLQDWGTGELNDFMIKLNAAIIVIFLEFILEIIRYYTKTNDPWWIIIILIALVGGFVGGFYLQKWHINEKTRKWRTKIAEYVKDIVDRDIEIPQDG